MAAQAKVVSKSKSTRKPAAPKAPALPKPEADATPIKVLKQPEKPFRPGSARDLYWQCVQEFAKAGLSYNQWKVWVEDPATCPLHAPARLDPENKLTRKAGGKRPPEKAGGWFGFFERHGLASKG